jgi:alpha-glucoside transport system substrate-binding protein
MDGRKHARRPLAAIAVVAVLLVVAACTGGQSTGGDEKSVTVVGTWGGSEQESFLAMVKPWEDRTGNKVKYTGSRGLGAYLTTAVQSGTLPDLAGLPGPGEMHQFYEQGALKALDDVLDMNSYKAETAPAFVELGTASDGKTIGVFIKSALKGLIWYNTGVFTGEAPTTWDAVTGADKDGAENLWCVGLESGADSGWPGTDWVEDIVLRSAGPDVYDKWVNGEQKWNSPEIKAAFETFGEVIADTYGGATLINSTNFGDGGNPLFTDPPGCLFHHQASFITDFFKKQGGAADGEFDFFPMPDINADYAGAFTGAGDLFGLFSDKAAAKDLLKYLTTAEAQQIWVDRGGALSGNTKVTKYPDPVSQRSAEILTGAKIFRFDGGDLMPSAMKADFFRAMVDFTEDPTKLDEILDRLDATAAGAYAQ